MVYQKEYLKNNTILIIENIYNQNIPKAEIIREIIESKTCLVSKYLVQSACRNIADYGSHVKEGMN